MTSRPSPSSSSPSSSSPSSSSIFGGIAAANPAAEANDDAADELSRCEWDFRLAATVPSPAMAGASDAIGSVDLDPSGALLATAGIARKVRIYHAAALLLDHQQSSSPAACICVPAKLSSVRWRPGVSSSVGCGDYDGVVTEYDVERGGATTWERDEHSGRRVWALDYSPAASSPMAASGSDDGTAHVWDPRASPSAGWATARAGGAVLCVEFDPSGAPRLAVGSADRKAALYDVRAMGRGPVATAEGHTRPVTYVRWAAGGARLVTSAADGIHRLWDWAGAQMAGPGREVRAYNGHVSGRSFVGMGLWRGPGLVACGSESNHVFVYDLRWPKPVWVHPFVVPGTGDGGFVSAVTWRQQADDGEDAGTLVAGGSDGVLKMFTCRRRRRRRRGEEEEEDDDRADDMDGGHQ